MAWLVSENKLDDQQRDFVENVNINQQNVWIKGFPGSGKSVLLAYTLKRIKNNNPSAKVAVVVFTHSLIAMFQAAFAEMGVSAEVMTYYAFMDSSKNYDFVLCDEVQDMTKRVLSSLNSRSIHVIVAGDENQSIYNTDPRYREDTVSPLDITSLLSCREFELGIIHRLSSSIISAVQKFMPNMNIFSSRRDLTKQSTQIRLCSAGSEDEEVEYIIREAQRAVNVGQSSAVLIPSQQKILEFIQNALKSQVKQTWPVMLNQWGKVDFNKLNSFLRNNGMSLQYVGNGYGSLSDGNGKIYIMTYHSAKGLDFDNVFLPDLNRSLYINSDERLSRTLFMVAMTRSRNNLYLLYDGSPSPYLSNFADECSRINVSEALRGQYSASGSANIFGI